MGQSPMAKQAVRPCQSHENMPQRDFHQTVLHDIPCEPLSTAAGVSGNLPANILAYKLAGHGALRYPLQRFSRMSTTA